MVCFLVGFSGAARRGYLRSQAIACPWISGLLLRLRGGAENVTQRPRRRLRFSLKTLLPTDGFPAGAVTDLAFASPWLVARLRELASPVWHRMDKTPVRVVAVIKIRAVTHLSTQR